MTFICETPPYRYFFFAMKISVCTLIFSKSDDCTTLGLFPTLQIPVLQAEYYQRPPVTLLGEYFKKISNQFSARITYW
jgi:hypothetical protein